EENTMLWFSSDNGPEGNESAPGETKFRGRKRSLYEGGVRVPGLLVWPARIKENRIVTVPCSTSDYFPTVLEALGYHLPEAKTRPYDGVSLLPLIDGKMSQRPRPIAFESAKQLALADNQYKIYRKDEQSSYELYDLIADPLEKTNLAEKHPKVLADMIATLEDWQRSCAKSNLGQDYGSTDRSETGTIMAGD
ncbi:MAG: N-acetylgalactosamine 6-sulfate sulfatase, partial [Planctomycetes bacterium]|nr:N-acetylgalactosamine 6-sulfate sulfatase [Planctomycetota bacterium]